ncbi:MAG: hypothetical protein AAGL99_15280 [Pseudomonadota bacterium]
MNERKQGDTVNSQLDIAKNRSAKKWTKVELIQRALWEAIGSVVFRVMPRQLWFTRRVILRCFGATVGRDVHIAPSVKIAIPGNLKLDDFCAIGSGAILYSLGRIEVGACATVSQYAHICAGSHDHFSVTMELLKTPIQIGADAWVCADAFIGPGVNVGAGAVIGARAVVTKSVSAKAIMVGNPAQSVGTRQIGPAEK